MALQTRDGTQYDEEYNKGIIMLEEYGTKLRDIIKSLETSSNPYCADEAVDFSRDLVAALKNEPESIYHSAVKSMASDMAALIMTKHPEKIRTVEQAEAIFSLKTDPFLLGVVLASKMAGIERGEEITTQRLPMIKHLISMGATVSLSRTYWLDKAHDILDGHDSMMLAKNQLDFFFLDRDTGSYGGVNLPSRLLNHSVDKGEAQDVILMLLDNERRWKQAFSNDGGETCPFARLIRHARTSNLLTEIERSFPDLLVKLTTSEETESFRINLAQRLIDWRADLSQIDSSLWLTRERVFAAFDQAIRHNRITDNIIRKLDRHWRGMGETSSLTESVVASNKLLKRNMAHTQAFADDVGELNEDAITMGWLREKAKQYGNGVISSTIKIDSFLNESKRGWNDNQLMLDCAQAVEYLYSSKLPETEISGITISAWLREVRGGNFTADAMRDLNHIINNATDFKGYIEKATERTQEIIYSIDKENPFFRSINWNSKKIKNQLLSDDLGI